MIGDKIFLALDLLHDLFIATKSPYVSVDLFLVWFPTKIRYETRGFLRLLRLTKLAKAREANNGGLEVISQKRPCKNYI